MCVHSASLMSVFWTTCILVLSFFRTSSRTNTGSTIQDFYLFLFKCQKGVNISDIYKMWKFEVIYHANTSDIWWLWIRLVQLWMNLSGEQGWLWVRTSEQACSPSSWISRKCGCEQLSVSLSWWTVQNLSTSLHPYPHEQIRTWLDRNGK